MLRTLSAVMMLTSAVVVSQRPFFAGSKPIGFPETPNRTTTTDPLGNRFGEGTTEKLPLEANGDKDLVDRLSQLPVDKQPFWLINWQALEDHRKNPQTYPQRPNIFAEQSAPVPNSNLNAGAPNLNSGGSNFNTGVPNLNSGGSNFNTGVPNLNSGSFNSNVGVPILNSGASNFNSGVPNTNSGPLVSNSGNRNGASIGSTSISTGRSASNFGNASSDLGNSQINSSVPNLSNRFGANPTSVVSNVQPGTRYPYPTWQDHNSSNYSNNKTSQYYSY